MEDSSVLVFDSVPATPHSETCVELAVSNLLMGKVVHYFPIYTVLPFTTWSGPVNGYADERWTINRNEAWLRFLNEVLPKPIHLITSPPVLYKVNSLDHNNYHELSRIDGIDLWPIIYQNVVSSLSVAGEEITSDIQNGDLCSRYKTVVQAAWSSALLCYAYSKDLIDLLKPKSVIIFNGRLVVNYPTYVAARHRGVKTIIHERGNKLDEYTIWARPNADASEISRAFSTYTKGRSLEEAEIGAHIFIARQYAGKPTGFAYSNPFRDDTNESIFIDGKYIVFFATSNHEIELYPDNNNFYGLGDQFSFVKQLGEVGRALNLSTVIRVHPNATAKESSRFEALGKSSNVIIVPSHSKVSSYELGVSAAFRISVGSTISWELELRGYPCALAGRGPWDHFPDTARIQNRDDLYGYLTQKKPLGNNKEFATRYCDFLANFGERFTFFKSEGSHKGRFDQQLIDHLVKSASNFPSVRSSHTGVQNRLEASAAKI